MSQEKEARWIIMGDGTPQMGYVGKTYLTEQQINEHIRDRAVLTLHECRAMRTVLIPGQSPEVPITQSNILTSHSIARKGIEMNILPTSYWWPGQDKNAMSVLERQIANCEKAEVENRLKEAGLSTDVGSEVSRQLAQKEGLRHR
jgi:hypothetical protein